MKLSSFLGKAANIALIVGFLILAWTGIQQEKLHFTDEHSYLSNVDLLGIHGLSEEFLLAYKGSAGPLFAVIHKLAEPLTRLEPPGLQLVNLVFLGLIIFFLSLTLKRENRNSNGHEALYMMAIPMIYVCTGLVLTEIPAMFFLVLSMWLLSFWQTEEKSSLQWVYLLIAGLAFSFAILGRQIYIVLFPAFYLLFLRKWPITWPLDLKNFSIKWPSLVLFTVFSMILPSILFYYWGGLTSVRDAAIYAKFAERGISLAPIHVVFALGYMAIICLLLAPGMFKVLWKKELRIKLLVGAGIWIVLNAIFQFFTYTAMETTIKRILPEGLLPIYSSLVAAALVILASGFVIALVIHGWQKIEDKLLVISILSCLAIAFTSIKITHQFSSRYTAQAAPFLIIIISRFPASGWWGLIGKVIGIGLGVISLYSYFS